MFADAIESIGMYTRPIRTISRKYNGKEIQSGVLTLFFVNDNGCAVTTKRVADLLMSASMVNKKYERFKAERATLRSAEQLSALEARYNYNNDITVQILNNFFDCVAPVANIDMMVHGAYDLAILRFRGFSEKHYGGHAVFAADGEAIRPGTFLCRLGFPFPEFDDFKYDTEKDEISWVEGGRAITPRFPLEGMFTRHIVGAKGELMGIELSTPGLFGQNGGPLFDKNGVIYGMTSSVRSLPVGEEISNEKKPPYSHRLMYNVGTCIHVNAIKAFLTQNNIEYHTL